jgi:hypothetical protein
MFSTRHELSCEAISRAKSIPFFYIFFSGRPFYFSPLHFLFEKISCHDDVLVLPIMYTVLCVISFSLTRFLLFFDSFFFVSFYLFLFRFPDRNCGKRSVRACAARSQVSVKPPSPCCVRKPHLENQNCDG